MKSWKKLCFKPLFSFHHMFGLFIALLFYGQSINALLGVFLSDHALCLHNDVICPVLWFQYHLLSKSIAYFMCHQLIYIFLSLLEPNCNVLWIDTKTYKLLPTLTPRVRHSILSPGAHWMHPNWALVPLSQWSIALMYFSLNHIFYVYSKIGSEKICWVLKTQTF